MKSCLIVDDSKVIRKVARHILETLELASTRRATDKKPCRAAKRKCQTWSCSTGTCR